MSERDEYEIQNPKPEDQTRDATARTWHMNRHANGEGAIHYANNPWVTGPGEIIFWIITDGRDWMFDLH